MNNNQLNNNKNFSCNNNCNNKFNNCKNYCNDKFNLNSLFEIENFLCNFRSACKCVNFLKFFK